MICTECGGTIVVGEGTECPNCHADMSRKNAFKPKPTADTYGEGASCRGVEEKDCDYCPSCGTPWIDHLGIQGTCAKLKEAEEVCGYMEGHAVVLNQDYIDLQAKLAGAGAEITALESVVDGEKANTAEAEKLLKRVYYSGMIFTSCDLHEKIEAIVKELEEK